MQALVVDTDSSAIRKPNSGDQSSISLLTTISAQLMQGPVATLGGRRAESHALASASLASILGLHHAVQLSDSPVDVARLRSAAIQESMNPKAIPREMPSRSFSVSVRGDLRRTARNDPTVMR